MSMQHHLRDGLKILAISSLLLISGFFNAQAQTRAADRPDLKITTAKFDGLNLHVEYVNATGVGYPKIRYEVGFQWHDISGSALGTRHWLPVPEVERGGVAILDNKYRIDLTYRGRDRSNYNRTLTEFLYQRPDKAEELRVMIDDGDRVFETDESNNIARLRIPLPDLQITGAKFLTPNKLELSYRNANPSPIPLPFRIGFTWAEESGRVINFTRFMNVLEPANGTTKTEILSRTDVSYINDQGRQVGDRLDWYLERRPGNAARLKIMIDEAGTISEVTEHNNLVSVRPDLPDLVVREAHLTDGQLSFAYGNAGEGYIRDLASRVLFQWRSASGQPVGSPRWSGFAQMDPKQMFNVNAERFDVEYAVPGTNRLTTQRLAAFVRAQPSGAARLDITIDDEGKILEANETNNTATLPIAPQPSALTPDLLLEDFKIIDQRPSFTYRNRGGPTPAEQRIPIAFEWLDQRGAALPLRFESDLGALLAGEFRPFGPGTAVRKWRVMDGRRDGEGGTVFFLAFQEPARGATALRITIDPANAIVERDEQNNTITVPINRADFTIREPRFDGAELSFTYAASGSEPTIRAPLSLWFEWANERGERVGDLAWLDIAFLPPGSSRAFHSNKARITVSAANGSSRSFPMQEFLAKPPVGARALRAFVDGPNRYDEPDEIDNTALLPIPDPSRPDFAITDATTFAADQLTVIVRNNGTGPAPEFFSYWFEWINAAGGRVSSLYWHDARGALAAGQEARLDVARLPLRRERPRDGLSDPATFSDLMTSAPANATHLKIQVDGPNTYPETDENNNILLLPKPIPPQPDLAISDLRVNPGNVITFTLQNAGNAATGGAVSLWFHKATAGGTQVGPLYWYDLPELPAGQTEPFNSANITVHSDAGDALFSAVFTEPTAEATHFKILVDGPGLIAEKDEGNNMALLERPRPPNPDIIIEDATLTNDRLTFIVANRGNAPVRVAAYNVRFEWLRADGQLTQGHPYPPVYLPGGSNLITGAPGESLRFSSDPPDARYEWLFRSITNPPLDAVRLRLTADASTPPFEESNEENNVVILERPRPLLPEGDALPDFAIENTSLSYASRGQGWRVGQLTYTIRNRGNSAAPHNELWVAHRWIGSNGEAKSNAQFMKFDVALPADGTTTFDSNRHRSGTRGVAVDDLAAYPPLGATQFEIIIDPWGYYREPANGVSNITRVDRPLPDFTFTSAQYENGRLTWELSNRSMGIPLGRRDGYQWITDFPVRHEWLSAAGTVLATQDTFVRGTITDGVFSAFDSNSIAAGHPFRAFFATPPAGATQIRMTVDPERVQPETNEDNNIITAAPPPLPRPDLAFERITITTDAPDPNIEYVAKNQGTAEVASTKLGFQWLSAAGEPTGQQLVAPGFGLVRAGGTSGRWQYPLQDTGPTKPLLVGRFLLLPPRDATHLKITLDPENLVVELDETNNSTVVDRPTSVPLSDLVISEAKFTLDKFALAYQNAGPVYTRPLKTPPLSTWFEWVDARGARLGELIWHDGNGWLAPKYRTEITAETPVSSASRSKFPLREFLAAPPPDATHLKVLADGPNALLESNETNNSVLLPRPIALLPDFALRDVVMTREKITMTLVNSGAANALRPPAWKFIWTDEEGGAISASPQMTYSIRWPAAGKSVPFELPYRDGREDAVFRFLKKPAPGALALKIVLDPENAAQESDEQNNTALVKLPALPDLIVSDLAVRDNALQISVRNNGTGQAKATDIWLMWFGAKSALPSSAAVDLPVIAKGARNTVSVPFDGNTEASKILREPPLEAKQLRIYLDGSRKVEEMNEQNNDSSIDRSNFPKTADATLLPDLTFTNVMVPAGVDDLVIGFQNAGKGESGPWVFEVRWIDANGKYMDFVTGKPLWGVYRYAHPGLPAGSRFGVSSYEKEIDNLGTPQPLSKFLRQMPTKATGIEIAIDPDYKVKELNENNNVRRFDAVDFPPSLRLALPDQKLNAPPKLEVSLSVEIIPIAAAAAASSVATIGLVLALSAFVGGTVSTYHHNRRRKKLSDFFAFLPLLLTSAHKSYMRLHACGPEGCEGAHFNWHKKIKRFTHVSMAAVVLTGAAKIILTTAAALLTISAQPSLAKDYTAQAGDQIRAALTVKNIGANQAQDLRLTLPCPLGTSWKTSTLNEKNIAKNSAAPLPVAVLDPGASHALTVTCLIGKEAIKIGTLSLTGSAQAKNLSKPVVSNPVTVKILAAESEQKPVDKTDLILEQVDILPMTGLSEATAEFEAAVIGIVNNAGKTKAGPSQGRLRLDIGNDGTWDLVSPLVEVDAIPAGDKDAFTWTFTWNAPIGPSGIEACADVNNVIPENNETNNCARRVITLQTGENPVVE